MPRITDTTRLKRVEHILASGTGVLDFAVEGETGYYTWEGVEDANWKIQNVESVENDSEDRFFLYPEGDYFTCEIEADGEENNQGSVRCWCD